MKKVFLGGTCNNSKWREELIVHLDKYGIDYFNPVVEDWTEECMAEELRQRESCDICLYCITPKMTGVYSIAEVVDDSNKHPGKTAMVILNIDGEAEFTLSQLKSLGSVAAMVEANGGNVYADLEQFVKLLNYKK